MSDFVYPAIIYNILASLEIATANPTYFFQTLYYLLAPHSLVHRFSKDNNFFERIFRGLLQLNQRQQFRLQSNRCR